MDKRDVDVKGNCCQECKNYILDKDGHCPKRCWGCVVISQAKGGRWFSHYEEKKGDK